MVGNYSHLLSLIIMSVKSGVGVEERARRNVMTGICTLSLWLSLAPHMRLNLSFKLRKI